MDKKTGYPHIDNIHKDYYGEKGRQNIDVNMSMYRYIYDRIIGFKGTAMTFYGKEITYEELLRKIENYAKSFYSIGIKPGDTVTFLLPSAPETYYMFYALDILGVKRNMVDLRTSVEGIKKYINETESKYLLCLNSYSPVNTKELLKTTSLKKVILTEAPFASIKGAIKRNIGKGVVWAETIGYKSLGEQIILPEEFFQTSAHLTNINIAEIEAPYSPNEVSLYLHTSGTMKFPKTVMVTDEKQNFVAAEYEKSLMDLKAEDKFLAIMPPWILYGIMGFHMPFSLRMNVFPVVDPVAEKFDDLVLNIKPNHIAGVPNHYISLYESKKINEETDLSFGKTYACGGAAINSEKQEEVSHFLLSHGASTVLNPGYSFSENCSIGSASQGNYVKAGSVGILLPDIEGMVIDPKTKQPLKYNEKGIICLRGALMSGYLNDKQETDKVIQVIDGKEWAISGDIGYFDEEGFLYIEGREKNLIVGQDGFKISPNEIESKICLHPEVTNCIVFGIKDKNHEFGDVPIAYIELKDKKRTRLETSKIVSEIKRICERELSSYYQPNRYFIGKIIYTPMMKDDKKAMSEEYEAEEKKGALKKLILGKKIYK